MKKSKRIKKSNSWKIKQHRDQFFKKSKALGYRSRASFKLIEINKKYKFLKKNTNLLDLGSCPGGWSQVASQIITNGRIMSIDLKDIEPIKNVKFLNGDIFEKKTKNEVIYIDTIYNPLETKTFKYLKKEGKKVFNGLDMFIYQGQKSFYLWNKINPEIDDELINLLMSKLK